MDPGLTNRRQDALGAFHVLPDELVCKILSLQSARDIGNLACVSSVFYILCNEEPLWMQICLENHEGPIDFNSTWKETALAKLDLTGDFKSYEKPSKQFQGFSSAFLYRRWYRCHVALDGFALDYGAVERRNTVSPQEFSASYDGKKPVLFTDLLDDWPARKTWTLDQLVKKCGDAAFKVSQPHGKPVSMTLEHFSRYMDLQHDEEPLYIFDPKFGESVPELLNDYKVPTLFSEDLFSVLPESDRPPYRWLVLGPAKSGAAWHVDPSLTGAWNSLLSGRKRWALYHSGKVPPGVTLDVDEDDGSVNYDGPSSLQWWLDVYPHLADCDKPLECTQLPGETIYVPSGWWHCVLNIDASIAVTQNYVNLNNFELVCMDLAPGYRHRAIARAGTVALEGRTAVRDPGDWRDFFALGEPIFRSIETCGPECMLETISSDRFKFCNLEVSTGSEARTLERSVKSIGGITDENLLLAFDVHLEEIRTLTGETKSWSNSGGSMTRKWLRTLWLARPELQLTIWKGACLALDAGTWLRRINVICDSLGFPRPASEEQLPVGDGSNPVYLIGDYVIKLYIQEKNTAGCIDALGSELNFYALLRESGSSFEEAIPNFVASGILYPNGDDYIAVPWDGRGDCPQEYTKDTFCGKKRDRDSPQIRKGRFRTKWMESRIIAKQNVKEPLAEESKLWPYLVTKRCQGKPLLAVRKNMTKDDFESLADFLGNQMRLLHSLPLPSLEHDAAHNGYSESLCSSNNSCQYHTSGRDSKEAKLDFDSPYSGESYVLPTNVSSPIHGLTDVTKILDPISEVVTEKPDSNYAVDAVWQVSDVWQFHVSRLREQHKSVRRRLEDWNSIPEHLLVQLEAYLPVDPILLVSDVQVRDGVADMSALPVWLHQDVMDDNIIMEECSFSCAQNSMSPGEMGTVLPQDSIIRPRYIIDFADILHGDPIYDLLPIHLDIFHLDNNLLNRFLQSYRLPFSSKLGVRYTRDSEGAENYVERKLSYCAMCHCLLHQLNAMSRIFKLRPELKTASNFEEIEEKVWGVLNTYIPANCTGN